MCCGDLQLVFDAVLFRKDKDYTCSRISARGIVSSEISDSSKSRAYEITPLRLHPPVCSCVTQIDCPSNIGPPSKKHKTDGAVSQGELPGVSCRLLLTVTTPWNILLIAGCCKNSDYHGIAVIFKKGGH